MTNKMKLSKIFFLISITTFLFPSFVIASSLDDLYRDIIRSDNSGYLPLFVKNRQPPIILLEEDDLLAVKQTNAKTTSTNIVSVKLSNDINKRSALAKARQIQWLKTVAAIKSNQVTPLELQDITSRAKENDPKAIEILAWMYTTGTGVSTDFIEAFNLYQKAANLNVANAEKNALIVYKSMNDEQRRKVKNRY